MSLKQAIEVKDDCIFIKSSKLKTKQKILVVTDDGYKRYIVKTSSNKLLMN